MDTRIVDLPAVRLVGHARRVPLVHDGVNPFIAEHVAAIPVDETLRLKTLNDTEPSGVLAVSDDLDPDRAEGTELTYLHGVATTGHPDGLDTIEVPAGTWAVFHTDGPHPTALQEAWGSHRDPSGSPRSRGGSGPDPRSWRCSSSTTQPETRPVSSGCRSSLTRCVPSAPPTVVGGLGVSGYVGRTRSRRSGPVGWSR